MPHIFISYAKKDTYALAEVLYNQLNAVPELTAWADLGLEADESWAYQIQQQIDRADYVVVLLSPDVNRPVTPTQRRSFVLNEIDYAQQDNKPILPVLVQPTKMPLQIAGVQYIDLTATPDDPKRVVERICRRFNLTTAEVSVASPAPPPAPPVRSLTDSAAIRAIIGEPFEWCEVPAGDFLYGDDKQTLTLPAFAIAKYPITYR